MLDDENNNEYERLKAELEKIRQDYNRAKRLLINIEEFGERFEKMREILDDEDDGVDKNFNWIKKKVEEISELKVNAQENLEKISSDLSKVKTQVDAMQSAYSEFSEIKGKISARSGEIEQLRETAISLKNDIENHKINAQQILENIKNLFSDAQQKIQNMQTAYDSFVQIKGKIEDPNSGLEAIFNIAQDLQKKSKLLFQEIQSFRDESNKLLGQIKINKEESFKLKNKIQENFDFTQGKKDEIEKITGLVIDTSFSETFDKRKREIEAGLNGWQSWKAIFLGSTILLVIVVILPFTPWVDLDNEDLLRYLVNRIFYATPLIFLIFFSASQYSKERDLAEKYAFKASSSAAIRNHIDFLINKFEKKDGIENFAKETFEKIYKEPYKTNEEEKKEIERLNKEIEGLKNKEKIDSQIDPKSFMESIKELKSLFDDESLFVKVIDFVKTLLSRK